MSLTHGLGALCMLFAASTFAAPLSPAYVNQQIRQVQNVQRPVIPPVNVPSVGLPSLNLNLTLPPLYLSSPNSPPLSFPPVGLAGKGIRNELAPSPDKLDIPDIPGSSNMRRKSVNGEVEHSIKYLNDSLKFVNNLMRRIPGLKINKALFTPRQQGTKKSLGGFGSAQWKPAANRLGGNMLSVPQRRIDAKYATVHTNMNTLQTKVARIPQSVDRALADALGVGRRERFKRRLDEIRNSHIRHFPRPARDAMVDGTEKAVYDATGTARQATQSTAQSVIGAIANVLSASGALQNPLNGLKGVDVKVDLPPAIFDNLKSQLEASLDTINGGVQSTNSAAFRAVKEAEGGTRSALEGGHVAGLKALTAAKDISRDSARAAQTVQTHVDGALQEVSKPLHTVDSGTDAMNRDLQTIRHETNHVLHETNHALDSVVHDTTSGVNHGLHGVSHGLDRVSRGLHQTEHRLNKGLNKVSHGVSHGLGKLMRTTFKRVAQGVKAKIDAAAPSRPKLTPASIT